MRKFWEFSFVGASVVTLCALASFSSSPAFSHEDSVDTSSTGSATQTEKSAQEQWLDKLWRESDEAFHKGDFPLAVEKFKAIVVLDPDDVEAFSTGAWLMWSLGNGDEASAFMRRGVQLSPNDGDMWEAAADHFDQRKVFAPEVLRDYQKALELAPSDKNTRLLRHRVAIAAQIVGDLELAQQVWTEVVKLYPDDVTAARRLQLLKEGQPSPAPRVDVSAKTSDVV